MTFAERETTGSLRPPQEGSCATGQLPLLRVLYNIDSETVKTMMYNVRDGCTPQASPVEQAN